ADDRTHKAGGDHRSPPQDRDVRPRRRGHREHHKDEGLGLGARPQGLGLRRRAGLHIPSDPGGRHRPAGHLLRGGLDRRVHPNGRSEGPLRGGAPRGPRAAAQGLRKDGPTGEGQAVPL
ncbi:MAG: hypothetical protein AVDCRST_MAG05-4094, partial [uncultured Rubrobacteraceae bacterium]